MDNQQYEPQYVTVTYEERRLLFFKKKLRKAEKRLDKAVTLMDKSQYHQYLSKAFERCSKLGEKVSYYTDVVEMLEKLGGSAVKRNG